MTPILRISPWDPVGDDFRGISQTPINDKTALPKLSSLLQHVHADHPSEHQDMSLTKAGKPRKRSERACTRCRELKVKCEPSNPMCSHCWRRGYVCDLVTRPRIGRPKPDALQLRPEYTRPSRQDSPVSPSSDQSSRLSPSPSIRRSPNQPFGNDSWPLEQQDISWQSLIDHSRPKNTVNLGKAEFSKDFIVPETKPSSLPDHIPTHRLHFTPDLDPYIIDRNLTIYYITQFLHNLDPTLEECIPRDLVMPWVMACRTKTAEDRMLLYAMLAMGAGTGSASGSSRETQWNKDGCVFARIAHSLLLTCGNGMGMGMGMGNCGDQFHNQNLKAGHDHDKEPLQISLTRLTLAMLAISQGRCDEARDLCRPSPIPLQGQRHFGVVPEWVIDIDTPSTPSSTAVVPCSTWEGMLGLDQDKLLRCRRTVAWCLRLIGSFASSWSGR
ncbi:hypothetical protein PV10_01492 [Exophiala mesophila]|uniref:Zn(2)-C6 fungal-type domain-containing protein n=1 Tax=Exophiala mesophila TaxID=212818 RepID=A0A0D1ZUX0_EXOME|nr:uncharacterized protein PV10_01492 [Exophiala mesophila]KIV97784.1 hypothetical protein PV10_01492 [Exophiala mesophila]